LTDPRPAPYPADTRAKGWRFELDYEQIEQSDTWGLATGIPLAQHALLMMWLVAWRQVPCGSLPADEDLIRAHCRIPPAMWPKMKAVLLRGWWPADDGRLYHDTLTKRALEMIQKRGGDASRKKLWDEKFYAIRDRDGGACVYCGATKYLSLDHLIASSRGGSGDASNLKGARTPDEAGLSFINKEAERLWLSIKETPKTAAVTRYQHDTNTDENTYHRPPKEVSKPSASHPSASADGAKTPTIPCPYRDIVSAYHEALPALPRIRIFDGKGWDARCKAMRELWGWVLSSRREDGTRRASNGDEAMGWVRSFFALASENDFVMGRTPRSGEHANWRADLDYLLTPRGIRRVVEKTQEAA
jgi:hypothetical protein